MANDPSNSFTNAFRQFLVKEKIDGKYREKLLWGSWETLMGKPIASRTTHLFIKEKVLYVKLTSAPLKQELYNNKAKVMEILSPDYGDMITDIRFL